MVRPRILSAMASLRDTDIARQRGRATGAPVAAARAIASLLALITAVLLFGLVDLGTLFGLVDQSYVWSVSLETSWGAFFTFVLAGSYAWIAVLPSRSWPAVLLLGIAGITLVLTGALTGHLETLWLAIPLLASAALLARLTSRVAGPVPRVLRLRWLMLVIAVAGLVLWAPYVLHALAESRAVDERPWTDFTWGISHWPVQAALGVTLAFGAFVMAFWAPSRSLFRFVISVSATLIGVAMLAYPDRDGATETSLWAISVALWGTAVALSPQESRLPASERADRSATAGTTP
jgi:hypothetical protein